MQNYEKHQVAIHKITVWNIVTRNTGIREAFWRRYVYMYANDKNNRLHRWGTTTCTDSKMQDIQVYCERAKERSWSLTQWHFPAQCKGAIHSSRIAICRTTKSHWRSVWFCPQHPVSFPCLWARFWRLLFSSTCGHRVPSIATFSEGKMYFNFIFLWKTSIPYISYI